MGAGCSGGSIMQLNIAAAYPGLLNGIQPNCTYPDTFTTAIEVMECGLLGARYYTTPNGSLLTTDQRNAINGHAGQGFCAAWNGAFLPSFNPSNSGNCGSGWPAALTFDKVLRPQADPLHRRGSRRRDVREDDRRRTGSRAATRRSTTPASSTG